MAVVSMVEALRRWARNVPDQPALTIEDETLTFRELELRSQRLAHTLLGMGVEVGDTVCIALPNSIEFVETALAVLKVGATLLPVSSRRIRGLWWASSPLTIPAAAACRWCLSLACRTWRDRWECASARPGGRP